MAIAVMMTSALNGLLVLRAYFRLFGGARVHVHAFQQTRPQERAGFLLLVAVLLVLGLAPRTFLMSRYRAAEAIFRGRHRDVTSSAPGVESNERALAIEGPLHDRRTTRALR
jgi:NADH-quinone oxidoreductase subunit M